jgi:hypothetical protein
VTNNFHWEDIGITASSTGPLYVMRLDSVAQYRIDGMWIGAHTHGLYLNNSLHGVVTNGLCGGGSVAGACFRLQNLTNVTITGWNMENGTPGFTDFIKANGNTVAANYIITNNSGSEEVEKVFAADAGVPFRNLTISNNSFTALNGGIEILGSGAKNGTRIVNNAFTFETGVDTPVAGDDCLNLNGLQDGLVSGNTCSGFHKGIVSANNKGATFRDNVLVDIADDCISGWSNDQNNLWVDNKIFGACGGKMFNSVATSLGSNTMLGTRPVNAAAKGMADKYTFTNLHDTDIVQLPQGVQLVTCADTGDASVQTAADIPYYRDIYIDNNDTTGGCDYTIGTGDAYEGMMLKVSLLETAGGVVRLLSGSANSPDAIALKDIFFFTFLDGVWALAPMANNAWPIP